MRMCMQLDYSVVCHAYGWKVRCRDDTVPKTVDTRKHCKVGLRACNNLPRPPPYIFIFQGCRRLLHALNPTLQCFLVSTVFGTVSSLHHVSVIPRNMIYKCKNQVRLHIFTLVYHVSTSSVGNIMCNVRQWCYGDLIQRHERHLPPITTTLTSAL